MRVVVSGASGLIGTALTASLRADGHEVLRLTRSPRDDGDVGWDPDAGELDPAALTGVDAAVHLAGAGIAEHRWTPDYKRLVLDSRVGPTELLARTLARLSPRPGVLLSGSAIGFYGDTGAAAVDESAGRGSGFLADVCVAWEAASAPAADAGIRVAQLRTGVVLAGHGAMMARLRPLFTAGLGGPIGSGRQFWSWISLTDEVRAIRFLLDHDVAGPVNLTGPTPVPQRQFATVLGRVLHRPAVLPTPGFAVRLAVGPFADEGILAGQRVLPAALEAAGFHWEHPDVESALRAELDRAA
jgi:uncharacterized protein (TIGR01777 family)